MVLSKALSEQILIGYFQNFPLDLPLELQQCNLVAIPVFFHA